MSYKTAAICAVLGVTLLFAIVAQAIPEFTSTPESLRYMRAGYFASHQTVAVTGASAKTTELEPNDLIRVVCSIDVHLDMGSSSVAATTSEALLPAYTIQSLRTRAEYVYIAFIRAGAANGTCYVTQVK